MSAHPSLRDVLSFYAEAGVDAPLLDEPVNRFEEVSAQANAAAPQVAQAKAAAQAPSAAPAPSVAPAAAPSTPTRSVIALEDAVKAAREAAEAASDLGELEQAMRGFEACNLKFTARSTVFADGNPEAPLMLIGEAPGRDEDEQGLPFVGRSGQLLDKMLAAIGHDRTSCYITNVIAWRPPGNRTPTDAENRICKPFVERHLELVDPKLVVLVGGSAAKTMLQTKSGIMSLRGKWAEVTVGETTWPALPMLHPSYLLRTPQHKSFAWRDLLAIRERLDASAKTN